MLFNPRAPLIFGSAAILLLAAYLAFRQPMPGPLAAAHARVEALSSLSGCGQCHHPDGLDTGCLTCHEEIAAQLEQRTGYHYHLAQEGEHRCQACHQEHVAREFPLVSRLSWKSDPARFAHPHVDYVLSGRHRSLECAACHRARFAGPVALPRFAHLERETTFLGLSQACVHCHADVHAGGLSGDCQSCHGQDSFRPAIHFDHSKFFRLLGAHTRAACARCHVIPEAQPSASGPENGGRQQTVLPFAKVRGTTCAQCHPSPHRAPLGEDCQHCHAGTASHWAEGARLPPGMSHAVTGFRLDPPHQSVACASCHPPGLAFDERYPDPADAGYRRRGESCQGCHRDIHAGQFTARHDGCLSCHEKLRFLPHRFGLAEHAARYPLRGAHGAVPCQDCHPAPEPSGVRRFAGTPTACQACHPDPHGGQFATELRAGDCSGCHSAGAETFLIRPFDHRQRAGYTLAGAHAQADCGRCHAGEPGAAALGVVRYRGTSRACASCHADVHRGQFRDNEGGRCERCHDSTTDWRADPFDHNRDARFVLTGVHAKVRCGECHPRVALSGGATLVQYKPLGKECRDCHGLNYP